MSEKTKYSKEDIIYFAGLFDGEGSISLHRKTAGNYAIHFTLGNTDKGIIDWILRNFGGRVSLSVKKGKVMNGGFCANKDEYTWELDIISLKKFLPELIPYLKIKKNQAIVMADYINNRRTNFTTRWGYPSWYVKWQDEICNKLKALKSVDYSDTSTIIVEYSKSLSDFFSEGD